MAGAAGPAQTPAPTPAPTSPAPVPTSPTTDGDNVDAESLCAAVCSSQCFWGCHGVLYLTEEPEPEADCRDMSSRCPTKESKCDDKTVKIRGMQTCI